MEPTKRSARTPCLRPWPEIRYGSQPHAVTSCAPMLEPGHSGIRLIFVAHAHCWSLGVQLHGNRMHRCRISLERTASGKDTVGTRNRARNNGSAKGCQEISQTVFSPQTCLIHCFSRSQVCPDGMRAKRELYDARSCQQ